MPGTTDRRATVVVAGADRWSAQDLAERIERYFADGDTADAALCAYYA
ncbi:hypothetical protein ACF09H_28040 [Streptomyces sp. NPDC014983]